MAIERYYVIWLYYDWYCCCRRRRLSNQSTQLFAVHSIAQNCFVFSSYEGEEKKLPTNQSIIETMHKSPY